MRRVNKSAFQFYLDTLPTFNISIMVVYRNKKCKFFYYDNLRSPSLLNLFHHFFLKFENVMCFSLQDRDTGETHEYTFHR